MMQAKAQVGQAATSAKQTARTFTEFAKKVQNDWVSHLAQALAFALVTALIPIAILLLALVGNFLGSLSTKAKNTFDSNIAHALPQSLHISQSVISSASSKLASSSGLLAFVAILTALIFGSRLFTLMEACFDVIYRLQPRSGIKQNVVAIIMLIVFVILTPILVLAGTIPDIVLSFLGNTAVHNGNLGLSIGGFLGSLIVSFILFEVFYVFVPNRTENVPSVIRRARTNWIGAAVAAVVLQLMLRFFPLYVQFFTKGYVGQVVLILAVVAFFYLFAWIILLGAEINAYFVEGIPPTPSNLISRAGKVS
jgi:uncharacterized BrkB/YihY/UPF0761 family membrane protein